MLLFSQPFQLATNFFFFLFVFGLFECRLQFCQFLDQVFGAFCQFTQSAEDLAVFSSGLLFGRLLLSLLLCFVAILFVFEFQFVDLSLAVLLLCSAGLTLLLLSVLPRDFELA